MWISSVPHPDKPVGGTVLWVSETNSLLRRLVCGSRRVILAGILLVRVILRPVNFLRERSSWKLISQMIVFFAVSVSILPADLPDGGRGGLVSVEIIPEDMEDCCREAAEECPTAAIEISE